MPASKGKLTPEPVATVTVCSVCGLRWELHDAKPTTDDCIRLLKAELAKSRFNVQFTQGGISPQPANKELTNAR